MIGKYILDDVKSKFKELSSSLTYFFDHFWASSISSLAKQYIRRNNNMIKSSLAFTKKYDRNKNVLINNKMQNKTNEKEANLKAKQENSLIITPFNI